MFSVQPLVSVVVPVFNAEKNFSLCLESITKQTYKNLEIIIVNDGSNNDETFRILEKYSQLDNRIIIITQENKGVSSARNKGIENSQGVYITFVDSDDWLDLKSIELQVESLTKQNCSVSIQGYIIEYADRGKSTKPLPFEDSFVTSKKVMKRFLSLHPEENLMGSCWSLMIHRNLIEKNNIRFDEDVRFSEDLLFACNVVSKTDYIACVDRPLYHYSFDYLNGMSAFEWQAKYGTHFTESAIHFLRKIKPYFKNDIHVYQAFQIAKYLECVDNEAVSSLSWRKKILKIDKLKNQIKKIATDKNLDCLPSKFRFKIGLKILNVSTVWYICLRYIMDFTKFLKSSLRKNNL